MAVALTMVQMKVAVLRHSIDRPAGRPHRHGRAGRPGPRGRHDLPGPLGGRSAHGRLRRLDAGLDLRPPSSPGEATRRSVPSTSRCWACRRAVWPRGCSCAAFVGVAPAISLLALTGLAVFGVRQGIVAALVSIPALLLQLVVFVLLSRVAVALLGLALRSRVGAIGAGLTNGLILATLGDLGRSSSALGEAQGIPPVVTTVPATCPPAGGWSRSRPPRPPTGCGRRRLADGGAHRPATGRVGGPAHPACGGARPPPGDAGRYGPPPPPAPCSPRNCAPGRATWCAHTS